jgi:mono/diheme cytochrome c family protein
MPSSRLLLRSLLGLWIVSTGYVQYASADEPLRYNRDVLPILADNCFACHGFDRAARQAGLRLDDPEGATAVLESGATAIVPGKPDESELMRRVNADDAGERMPPEDSEKQLSAEQREILRRWISEGAVYQKHWAFIPPRRSVPPELAGVAHPIDRFIQARLSQQNLSPSAAADDATLMRRVSLDLTGLPPEPVEVDAFLAAAAVNRDAAYAELVERLLASPHYGERWARWWLDQARYADSNGYSIDAPREIWKYRDWVIEALNADMPFNQFTIEQLAGDLLPNATESQKIATGFHRNTQINQEGGIDREQFRVDSVFDRVATTGTVWLGLTVGCCQCHDHKFDPVLQTEYYRLFAFFNNQNEPTLKVYGPDVDVTALTAELNATEQALAAIIEKHAEELAAWEAGLSDEQRKALPADVQKILDVPRDQRNAAQHRDLFAAELGTSDQDFIAGQARLRDLGRRLNDVPTTMVLQELPAPRKTTVFIKGDFTRPAEEVTPGTPSILHPFENASDGSDRADRLDLALWITSPQNPLTARVIANRVWQVYFGRGIVETENDFGTQGSLPSHPDLLDWLALEFQQRGWSLKELHRRIVMSHTYRQSSADRPELRAKDPHNYLLGRQRRLRLEAEIIRDVSLAASGLLSHKLGGPPVFPPIPEGVMDKGQVKRQWTISAGEDKYRRGIYTFVYRATPPPALNVFDAPDGYSSCTRRLRSNTPLQALTLLNDSAFFEFASALEQIIRRDGLVAAFRRCTGRRPRPEEMAVLQQLDALSAARVLLNLDETVTRE